MKARPTSQSIAALAAMVLLAPFATAQEVDLASAAKTIVQKTNKFRAEHDLPPVDTDEKLTATAQDFADFMARTDKYGHGADGRTPSERAEAHGYDFCVVRENIAYRKDPRELTAKELAEFFTQGWIESPGHRENMLADYVTETGVAVATTDGTTFYAVQLFGRPKNRAYRVAVTNETDSPQTLRLENNGGSDEIELPPRTTLRSQRCFPITLRIAEAEAKRRVKEDAKLRIVERDGKLVFDEK